MRDSSNEFSLKKKIISLNSHYLWMDNLILQLFPIILYFFLFKKSQRTHSRDHLQPLLGLLQIIIYAYEVAFTGRNQNTSLTNAFQQLKFRSSRILTQVYSIGNGVPWLSMFITLEEQVPFWNTWALQLIQQ